MFYFLAAVAALHVMFMGAELFPWRRPLLLTIASKKLPSGDRFTKEQLELVSTIVHNAGIYNGIIAGGLLWAAFPANNGHDVARVMLMGATAAGVFGTATLRSLTTGLQAVVGIIGLILV